MRTTHMPLPMIPVIALLVFAGVANAQTPDASPVATPVTSADSWQATERREIEVDGKPVALSPDGRWIAGTGPNDAGICVWEVESLSSTCVGDDVLPDRLSLVWAPDSSAIAFTDGSVFEPEEPNVLWLFSLAEETLTELSATAVGESGLAFHAAPAWTPDSQRVVFLQAELQTGFQNAATMAFIDRSGGDAMTIPMPPAQFQGPLRPTADGRVIFTIGANSPESGIAGLWQVGLDGSGLEQLLATAGFEELAPPLSFGGQSADGRYLGVLSLGFFNEDAELDVWYVLDMTIGTLTPIQSVGDSRIHIGPVFGPSGFNAVALTYDEETASFRLEMLDAQTGHIGPIAGADFVMGEGVPFAGDDEAEFPFLSWGGDNTVLLSMGTDAVLLTLEQTP